VRCAAYSAQFERLAPSSRRVLQAFVSHSWHDSAQETLDALREWRRAFVQQHGREPTVWLDKCCLHPEFLSQQLSCLPVFCAACDSMLALRGATYLSRMVRARLSQRPAERRRGAQRHRVCSR
jgi:hypothetical protein